MASIEGNSIKLVVTHGELNLIRKALEEYYRHCPTSEEDAVRKLESDLS